jgi:hypothetical protein
MFADDALSAPFRTTVVRHPRDCGAGAVLPRPLEAPHHDERNAGGEIGVVWKSVRNVAHIGNVIVTKIADRFGQARLHLAHDLRAADQQRHFGRVFGYRDTAELARREISVLVVGKCHFQRRRTFTPQISQFVFEIGFTPRNDGFCE